MRKLLLAASLVWSRPRPMPTSVVTADRISTSSPANMSSIRRSSSAMTAVSARSPMRGRSGWGADVKQIDLAGKTLLPGLIDMHVHLTAWPTSAATSCLEYTDSFRSAVGAGQRARHARGGLHHRAQRRLDPFRRCRPDAGDRRRAGWLGRGSCPPPMRSARPAAIATTPSCRPNMDTGQRRASATVRRRARSLRSAGMRKYGARGDQDLRHRRRLLARRHAPGQQQLTEEEMRAIADEAHMQGPQGRRPRPWRRRHQRRDPRRDRHDRACQPARRRGHQARRRAAADLVLDGHLQHRLHPGRGRRERRARGQPPQGPRDRPDPARQFPQGA